MKLKILLPFIAIFACFISVTGQKAIRDTIFVYENVIVFDTIVIRDTVRIKDFIEAPVTRPKKVDQEKIFSPLTATFSEKYILSSKSTNEVQSSKFKSSKFKVQRQKDVSTKKMNKNNNKEKKKSMKKDLKKSTESSTNDSEVNSLINSPVIQTKTAKSTNVSKNLTKILSSAILTVQSLSGISAQDTISEEKEQLRYFPVQLSFVYPMSTMGNQTVDYRYGLSVNLISGKVGGVNGVEFGGIKNTALQDVYGVQFAGIGNKASKVSGVQFAGIYNVSHYINGIQFGGIINFSNGILGVQYGGIKNMNNGDLIGIQFAGISNVNTQKVNGIQSAGISNVAENIQGGQFAGIINRTKKVDGAQFAGIMNVSDEVEGVCFGGIYNRTGTLNGAMFAGILNVVDTIESGVSIAFINVVKKGGYKEFSVSFADYMNVGFSYKMGTRKFYTLFSLGANFIDDKTWITGIGFGNRTTISPRFDIQPEIIGYQYFPLNFKNVYNLSSTHLKFGFIYKFNDRLGLSVAPSIYYLNSDMRMTERVSFISPIKEWERDYSYNNFFIDVRHSFGVGFSVGLAIN